VTTNEATRTTADWAVILKERIIDENINDDTSYCLIKYLADLGVIKNTGEERWTLLFDDTTLSEEQIKTEFIRKFEVLRQSESGSLLKYFTGESLNDEDFKFPSGDTSKVEVGKDKKISSNLSNYQIVRKMGRQLSPFIELEKNIINKLEGQYVTRGDAKILFKYILSKIQTREKPREWEQISRRRHK
jgi:hypothetical protein